MNVLKYQFETSYQTPPFSKIKNEDFLPAIKEGIAQAKAEIQAIIDNIEEPTFENTIEALAFSGLHLDRVTSIFFNLHSAETNEEIENIAQEAAPILSEFSNDITLNFDLFEKVKAVYDKKASYTLTPEQEMLLDNNYKSFVRNGALLNDEDKLKLREISTELSKLTLTFSKNVLADQNAYQLHLTKKSDVAGIPDAALEAAADLAKTEGKEGWIFTLDYPSYIPFMKFAKNRELRKELAIANGKKGFQDNENNNEKTTIRIAQLRFQKAQLLGYQSHAHFVLEERMAESPAKVKSFLDDLLIKAKPAADKEFSELEEFAKDLDQIDRLEKWDSAFYENLLKQKRFNLDDEKLKPYFKLECVLAGAYEVANRLFGLTFNKLNNIDKYHEEVDVYEVKDENGEFIAVFYTDFFPRKGKRNGAWMTSYKNQYRKDGINERPQISIVCNFSRPTASQPSLLTFNEVTTLFHEFGHALHGMLADTVYPGLSGTNVYWDFVELPSQVMENWCYEKETLELFAKHYKTGEIIPIEMVEKIKESANFHEGMATVRQLSFGMLDMGWHGGDPSDITDLKAFELAQFAPTQQFPDVKENAMSTAFSHIFSGGYSSGYYSYKWAEVLDADAFEYFKENGIFNREIADKFKDNILSKGGTEHPMKLYKKFRGEEPKVDALLRRAGLL